MRAVISTRRAKKQVDSNARTALDNACVSAEGGVAFSMWLLIGFVLLGAAVVFALASILTPKKRATVAMFASFIAGAVLLVHAT
jgi:hypothetical protein